MPAIKKKWIKANQGETSVDFENIDNNDNVPVDGDRELAGGDTPTKGTVSSPAKQKKRLADPTQGGMLRGLDGEVLLEKRKRFVPPAEAKLEEWLDSNLEKRNNVTLSLIQLYKYYTELCQGDGSDILDVPAFNRMVKKKFGKTVGIKESSMYKTVIKERNLDELKKKAGAGIKLKEIAHEAINHFGNPWNGVRFFSLKQYVGTKYPFLQIDQRPKVLKRILEMGVGYGQIDLVKGIGMAGFYRLPGAEPPKPKAKPGKEEAKDKAKPEEADSAGSDAQEPKEGSAETGEKIENATTEGKEAKPKSPKPKKIEKCNLMRISHGNPKKIEDTFPMAITFQSAPKTASIVRIRRYILDHYKETVGDHRWRKAMEGGADKGHWEYISGSGITGRLHLLMDDFDPESEHLEDQICAAIIACHEPKAASGNQIKKYVSQYHPDFQVDGKPDRFKKALIRAAEKSMIVQVSGLGANGSFQLCDTFVPSPRVLSGEDASSGEEDSDDSSDEEPVYIPKGTKSRGRQQKKPERKQEVVVRKPKPGPKKAAALNDKQNKNAGKGRERSKLTGSAAKGKGRSGGSLKMTIKKSPKKKGKKSSQDELVIHSPSAGSSSDEEDEKEEQYTPRKSQSRGGPARSSTPNKTKKGPQKKPLSKLSRARKRSHSSSDDDNEDDREAEYTPRKSQSRGGPIRSTTPNKTRKNPVKKNERPTKSPAKSTERRPAPKSAEGNSSTITTLKMNFSSDSDGADADSETEYTPRKSSSRGGGGKAPTSKNAKEIKSKKRGKKRS